jgi:peptidoglycan/xylan/chitin deacetylase (PgdA/CDA1 family)
MARRLRNGTLSDRESMAHRLPILTLHSIDDAGTVISFPRELLQDGLERLQAHGHISIALSEALAHIHRVEPFPDRSFVITFDDGYRSVFEEAFPILQQFGMTATVFLTVGKPSQRKMSGRIPSLFARTMLSWDEIRAMHLAGISFGAHTLTHPKLPRISHEAMRCEIHECKAVIEDELGTAVDSFAYPYGCCNALVKQVVEEFFGCGCTDELGLVNVAGDPYALPRIDGYFLRHKKLFDLMTTQAFSFYIRGCNLIRASRRALLNPCSGI